MSKFAIQIVYTFGLFCYSFVFLQISTIKVQAVARKLVLVSIWKERIQISLNQFTIYVAYMSNYLIVVIIQIIVP